MESTSYREGSKMDRSKGSCIGTMNTQSRKQTRRERANMVLSKTYSSKKCYGQGATKLVPGRRKVEERNASQEKEPL
jgi:hypothetical protein